MATVTLSLEPMPAGALRLLLIRRLAGAADVLNRATDKAEPDLDRALYGREALNRSLEGIDQIGWGDAHLKAPSVELTMDAEELRLALVDGIESNDEDTGTDLSEIRERHSTQTILLDLLAQVDEQVPAVA